MKDNELIAQFMGTEIKCDMMGNENPNYGSWDKLILVVEKIIGMETTVTISNSSCRINTWIIGYNKVIVAETKMATYWNVIEFIKWHNLKTKSANETS